MACSCQDPAKKAAREARKAAQVEARRVAREQRQAKLVQTTKAK